MSLVVLAVILSVVGSIAFAIAGFVIGRTVRASAPQMALPAPPLPAVELVFRPQPSAPPRHRDMAYREDRLAAALSRLTGEGEIVQVVLVDEQGLACAATDDSLESEELAAVGAQAVGLIHRMDQTVGVSRAVAVDLDDRRVLDVRPFEAGGETYFTVSIGARRVDEAHFNEVVQDLRRLLAP